MNKKTVFLMLLCLPVSTSFAEKDIPTTAVDKKTFWFDFALPLGSWIYYSVVDPADLVVIGSDGMPVSDAIFKSKEPAKKAGDLNFNKKKADVAAKTYKIHLMPLKSQEDKIKDMLIQAMETGNIDTRIAHTFKILNKEKRAAWEPNLADPNETVPIIVMYVRGTPQEAQKVLNQLYALLKDIKGRNVIPAFNIGLNKNGLIYVTQGHRTEKLDMRDEARAMAVYGDDYPEQDNPYTQSMIYYKPNIGSETREYRLKHPMSGSYLDTPSTAKTEAPKQTAEPVAQLSTPWYEGLDITKPIEQSRWQQTQRRVQLPE